jgi:2-polyprenyl-3-methyl-5-hydroxy-6-metoxy-1,4-benzoquinol methylase
VCGSSARRTKLVVQTTRRFEIDCCTACGLAFALPRPSEEELVKFYTSDYFSHPGASEKLIGYSDYAGMGELNARAMWRTFRDEIAAPDLPKSLLDVGAATGGFIDEARKDGWTTEGVELSEEAARIAREEFGVTVHHGDVFSPALAGRRFDVVTMWHVLEHCIDPLGVLRQARSLLAPGGMLFVELPNWNSLGRRVRGARWSQLKPPEHINFFTPRSLVRAAELAGFIDAKAWSVYPPKRPHRPEDYQPNLTQRLRDQLARMAGPLGWGGYARLVARQQ